MTRPELAHLELLAEVDALAEALARWVDRGPDWQAGTTCRALVRRLGERLGTMRVRLESPLVVATLGGTGTGKSSLVNALVGADIAPTGRSRPTTRRPTLVCRTDIMPEMLGIEPGSVELVQRDLPALADLVLLDCPDPDTTESTESPGTNLARLRHLLPHCDLLLITTTQQKYRSARVAEELATAASGARLVFVQTHADTDEDIRDDWREMLASRYATGHIFLVDSPAALADGQKGLVAGSEFGDLVDLLTRQLAGTAAARIRRANLLDLVAETLAVCRTRIEEGLPAVGRLQEAIDEARNRLAAKLAGQMHTELLGNRRQWENRLLGRVASRWGFSPFSLLLRIYQALGGLATSALLLRARSPAQVALWGAVEGARSLEKFRRRRRADQTATRAVAGCWNEAELREAAVVLDGYAGEAGLDRQAVDLETVSAEAAEAGENFVAGVAGELEALISRVAGRHSGWFTRWRYELMLLLMLGVLFYRPAKNFFYDSWLAQSPRELLGLDFYLVSTLWLLAWCGLLIWSFTSRLRRGLKREIHQLAERWRNPRPAGQIFSQLEWQCRQVRTFRDEAERLEQHVATLGRRLALPEEQVGSRR